MHTSLLPLYLHALIELPASLNFFFRPSSQLSRPYSPSSSFHSSSSTTSTAPPPSPQTLLILRQYALALFSTVLLSLLFAQRNIVDSFTRNASGALAIYHLGPIWRARWRVQIHGEEMGRGEGLQESGPKGNEMGKEKKRRGVIGDLGGPYLHLLVHGVCFGGLGAVYFGWGS